MGDYWIMSEQTKDSSVDIDEMLITLLKENNILRKDIVDELKKLDSFSIGWLEAVYRKRITTRVKSANLLEEKFFVHDDGVNTFISYTSTFTGPAANLNLYIKYGIKTSHLMSLRNSVSSLLNQIHMDLNDKKNRANNILTLMISIIALTVSILSMFFTIYYSS